VGDLGLRIKFSGAPPWLCADAEAIGPSERAGRDVGCSKKITNPRLGRDNTRKRKEWGMGGCRFVRAELENGMAIKGGSAVLSQISRRLFRPVGLDTLVQCPKIVHDRRYPIAPKLVPPAKRGPRGISKGEPLQRHTI